jgi:hypothetical protein
MEDVDIADASKALFEAPFGVLAHRFPEASEEQSEPTFVYANQVAPPVRPGHAHRPLCGTLLTLKQRSVARTSACSTCPPMSAAPQVALDLFETSWDELIGQPSRVSAAPDVRNHLVPEI